MSVPCSNVARHAALFAATLFFGWLPLNGPKLKSEDLTGVAGILK